MTEIKKDIKTSESVSQGQFTYQRDIFPVDIVDIYPSDQNSADLKVIGLGRNDKEYAIKRINDGTGFIPASELFCYELAKRINIPTPEFDVLRLQDDELAFGSVWEGGVHKISYMNEFNDILNENIVVNNLSTFFGKVYGFDLFINNIDRHPGNYLFRQSYNFMIALAFDYSRAWLEVDYSGYQAIDDKKCNTQTTVFHINNFKKIDLTQSKIILDELSKIDKNAIKGILSEIPNSWLTEQKSEEIIQWWGSKEFTDRINILKGGVGNDLV